MGVFALVTTNTLVSGNISTYNINMRISKKTKKVMEQAAAEARIKPEKKRKKGKRTKAGEKIPDNVWLDDEQQGCVFAIDGNVIGLEVNYETGKIRNVKWKYSDWKIRNVKNESGVRTKKDENVMG